MAESMPDLNDIPVIDNHCHAGMLEMTYDLAESPNLHEMRNMFSQMRLQSALTRHEYHLIQESIKLKDEEKTEDLYSQFGYRNILSQHPNFTTKTSFIEVFQEKAYLNIYGPVKNDEELETRIREQRKLGFVQSYVDILDKCEISIALTNIHKFALSKWPKKRFRWLPHLDTFIFPFGGEQFLRRGGSTEDYGSYIFRHPEREIVQHLRNSGLKEIPRDFSDYLTWVRETLSRLRNEGAAAMKLLMAYFRTLKTEDVNIFAAEESYKKGLQGDIKSTRNFEDFMVRELICYCGELDLPVQIHVGDQGPGPGLILNHSHPIFLQSILEHPKLRKTRIVLLHGGFPYTKECGRLVYRYWNVYLDLSWISMNTSFFFENQLINWMEWIPTSKILFGSDAWTPEMFWVGIINMKKILRDSLNKMIKAGFYNVTEALEIAHSILYRNSCRVYNLPYP